MPGEIIGLLALLVTGAGGAPDQPTAETPGAVTLRVATFNLEDVRGEESRDPRSERLRRIASIIQRVRPNVLFLNEIACDMPGAPGVAEGGPTCDNAQRFADNFLSVPQGGGLEPIRYRAYMAPVNTGVPSGFDLDHDG